LRYSAPARGGLDHRKASYHVGIGFDAQSRLLRPRYATILWSECTGIELSFEIKSAPLDHCLTGAQRGRGMDRR
jgi:hypothetical protein